MAQLIGRGPSGQVDMLDLEIRAHSVLSKKNPITGSGTTYTLTSLLSGSAVFFDSAAGIVYTLPAITTAKLGMYFDFLVSVTITSNAAKVITDAGTTLLFGSIINTDTDSSNAVASWTANGTTHLSVSMNGTTTGGLKGDWLRFTAITTTAWLVTGVTQGTGTVATPFATS